MRVKLDFEKLEDVKKRLAQLKIEPITPETTAAIRELAKDLQKLAKALEQVQKYSKTTQLGQRNFTNDVQLEYPILYFGRGIYPNCFSGYARQTFL